jgi:hypothetical protein
MRLKVIIYFLLFQSFLIFSGSVFAEDTMEKVNSYLLPQTIQTQFENNLSWFARVCNLPLIQALCPTKTHQNLKAPDTKSVQVPKDEIERAEFNQQQPIVEGEATSSSVLMDFSIGEKIDTIKTALFGSKETGWAWFYTPQNAPQPKDTGQETLLTYVGGDNHNQGLLAPQSIVGSPIPTPETEYIPPEEVVPTGEIEPLPSGPPIEYEYPSGAEGEIRKIVVAAANWSGVPWPIIEAMLHIEGPHVFTLSVEEIIRIQQPNEKLTYNCQPNVCSAAGPMQLTTVGCQPFDTCQVHVGGGDTTNANCTRCPSACSYYPSAWSGLKNSVLEAENDGRTPNICNLKDSLFAAAKKMKINAQEKSFPEDSSEYWNKDRVFWVARRYYGSCTTSIPRLENKTYCQYVWDYLQKYKSFSQDGTYPTPSPLPTSSRVAGGADEVIEIVQGPQGIGRMCNGCVDPDGRTVDSGICRENQNCIDRIYPLLTQDTKGIIKASATYFFYLQCVGWARSMMEQTIHDSFMTNENAIGFFRNPPPGWRAVRLGTSYSPRIGDALIWDSGVYGHIAYVVRVDSPTSVRVAEANWGQRGRVQIRPVTLSRAFGIIGWLTAQ